MYNKSEIMKKAWSNFKNGEFDTFGQSLKSAWYEAKTIIVSELKTGDVVKVEYGDTNNWVTCRVLSIESELSFGHRVINAVAKNSNREFEICIKPAERVLKSAA